LTARREKAARAAAGLAVGLYDFLKKMGIDPAGAAPDQAALKRAHAVSTAGVSYLAGLTDGGARPAARSSAMICISSDLV
jgi:hypothetical protein